MLFGANDVCKCVLHLILFYHIFFIFSLSIEINWECSLSAALTRVARTKPSTSLPIIGTLFWGNQVFYFRFMVSAPPRPVCPFHRSFLLIRPQNSPPGATMSTVNFYTWADWYYVLISNKMVSLTTTENKTRVLLCKRLFGSGQDLIIRAQSTAIFLCIQPFSAW